MQNIIGIDIGGTKCAIILGSYNDQYKNSTFVEESIDILDRIVFRTEIQKDAGYTLDKIMESIELIFNRGNKRANDIQSIGISCGGPLDSKKGIILSPPNLFGWDSIEIVKILENRFGIRTKLQNDANACTLAEWRFGAAKGYNNVVFLTFGTGMGAGLILDGELYSGTNDMAGEVGHIRLYDHGPVGYGKAGSFEGFCSGGGIAQIARMKVLEKLQKGEKVSFCKGIEELDRLNAKLISDEAERGDELAKEIYSISGHYLGQGIAILIDILNPEIIVIGSIFARSKNLLWDSAIKVIKKETISHSLNACKIVPAGLGEQIGDYASLSVALY